METYKIENECQKTLNESNMSLINFSHIFPRQISDDHPTRNFPMLIQYIESIWDEASQSFQRLPNEEVIAILTDLVDFLRDETQRSINFLPDSLYNFLTYLLFIDDPTIKTLPVIEMIFSILHLLSIFDFNQNLTFIFENISAFLFSESTVVQNSIIATLHIFLKSEFFFYLACANDFPSKIYDVINVSGDPYIIQISFTFLSSFVKRYKELIPKRDTLPTILNQILISTFGFIHTCRRFDLLPNPFHLLKICFEENETIEPDSLFIDTAKDTNMANIFSTLLQNSAEFWSDIHPELFLDSLHFLTQYWPDCPLFDEDFIYDFFYEIFKDDDKVRTFRFVDFDQSKQSDTVQIVAIKVLSSMIPRHYHKIASTDLIMGMINRSEICSFDMKQAIVKFIMDFMTFSTIEIRRQLMSINNEQGEGVILSLMIDSIITENVSLILCIVSTILHMRTEDEEYWNFVLINHPALIEALENISNETGNDEVHKIVELLLAKIIEELPQE